jgi:hypothetical protein
VSTTRSTSYTAKKFLFETQETAFPEGFVGTSPTDILLSEVKRHAFRRFSEQFIQAAPFTTTCTSFTFNACVT